MAERKYRHAGYMDKQRTTVRWQDAPYRRTEDPERKPADLMLGDLPRGRAASGPTQEVFRCAGCGESLTDTHLIANDTVCPRCAADLHTCTHCVHFDSSARFECKAETPARIAPKNRRNSCPLFKPRTTLDGGSRSHTSLLTGSRVSGEDDPRLAFERLFKK